MTGQPSIVTLTNEVGPGQNPVAVVSAPDVPTLIEAAVAAVEQGYFVRVQVDDALGNEDPIALFSILASCGVSELETSHVKQAKRCGAMNTSINTGAVVDSAANGAP